MSLIRSLFLKFNKKERRKIMHIFLFIIFYYPIEKKNIYIKFIIKQIQSQTKKQYTS